MRIGWLCLASVMMSGIAAEASPDAQAPSSPAAAPPVLRSQQSTPTDGFIKAVASSYMALGDLYRDGKTTVGGAEAALAYYRGLANPGRPDAIYAIISPSDLIGASEDAPADPFAATELYLQAAAMGSAEALMRLGDLYREGRVVAADPKRAYLFYDQAAKAGSDDAKLRVGEMLARGQGVARDTGKGLAIIAALADSGNAEALVLLGDLYRPGGPGMVAMDPAKAFDFYRKAVALGYDAAKLRIGEMTAIGQGVAKDVNAGIGMIEEVVARTRNPAGLVLLGSLYSRTDGGVISIDFAKAFGYFRRAADSGDETGILRTGEMLARGRGTGQSYQAGRAMLAGLAGHGDTFALIALGDLLSDPTVAPVDLPAAVASYDKAASLGHSDALVRLGDLYSRNGSVASELPRAFSYYVRASQAGNIVGKLRVGEMTLLGRGTNRDVDAGLAQMNALADDGDPEALNLLGALYQRGIGGLLQADPARAYGYFSKSADAGNVIGSVRAGEMMVRGQGTTKNVVDGLALVRAAADAGSSEALMSLGTLMADGSTGAFDAPEAVRAYEKAAVLGRPDALVRIGDIYRVGGPIPVDPGKAFEFYRRAGLAGDETGRLRQGEMTARGEGTSQDIAAGLDLVRQVGAAGDPYAYVVLGDLHLSGAIGSIDGPAAVAAYESAARQGRADALLRLGDLYRDGRGVPADGKKAAEYYLKAVDAEDPTATAPGESVRY
ncbi:Putative beta-lactamase HcpC precursor [Aminobacter sp. MSH1]|uniref:tetratricopeptide repeat protein n=1 Tax=Aminobacter sp. MSH1 TaxID=374606 RepID=UPI000D504E6F|nr:tetratricopeptide repeat protein [Aminobacter sp. MSH1]AWC24556.1 Putative beta-lactamase HcpC precursor [Aminobacter sp. MSH1]